MKLSATTLKGIAILALLFAIQVSRAAESLNSQAFQQARQQIANMLSGKTALNFERAVFLTENAFWNNELDEKEFSEFINHHALQIQKLVQANNTKTESDCQPHIYKNVKEQYDIYLKSLTNWAIFTYLTDTTYFLENNSIYYHLPYTYSSNDPLGMFNFSNTQVNKLLYADDRSGNCYALTALFKILSERLQSNAAICTAPGHIYIRHADQNGILFNVELATKAFPGTGSLSTLTYTTNQAIESGISMRMLSLKESVALTLIYLAKGYQHRFNTTTDNFMLECAELALQHDSLNLNAMLLKAEVLESRLLQQNKNLEQLRNDHLFQEYEQHITNMFDLGYREMPKDMKALVINKLRNPDEPVWAADKTPNAFADLPNAKSRFATLSWGLFDEQMLTKPVEYYGRTAYNTATKKIQQFIPKDSLKDYPIDPVVFALSIDPLAHKFPSMSPYSAFASNPLFYVDKDGREVFYYGKDANKAVSELKKATSLDIKLEQNKVSLNTQPAMPMMQSDQILYDAISDQQVNVNIYTTDGNWHYKSDGSMTAILIGSYDGSKVDNYVEINPKVQTTQYINLDHSAKMEGAGNSTMSKDVMHETIESYISGRDKPGESSKASYNYSHNKTEGILKDNMGATQYKDVNTKTNTTEFGFVDNKNGKRTPLFSTPDLKEAKKEIIKNE
ncbi:MAG: hypothetical protein KF706_03465 [Chitinophagales bacterium]|nr:hypothetical protein [Chitinophagales bacterium]